MREKVSVEREGQKTIEVIVLGNFENYELSDECDFEFGAIYEGLAYLILIHAHCCACKKRGSHEYKLPYPLGQRAP